MVGTKGPDAGIQPPRGLIFGGIVVPGSEIVLEESWHTLHQPLRTGSPELAALTHATLADEHKVLQSHWIRFATRVRVVAVARGSAAMHTKQGGHHP